MFLYFTPQGITLHLKKRIELTQDKHIKHHSDTLNILLLYHASDYFIYKGATIGFQNDLFKEMGNALGLTLNITIEDNYDSVYQEVFQNNYDLIAIDFQKNSFLTPFLTLSTPHSYSYPVMITRKIKCDEISPDNQIYIPAYFHHLISLDSTFEDNYYNIQYSSQYNTEELFEMVESGEIDYFACDDYLALTLLPFYPKLKIEKRIGSQYSRCWVLNKYNPTLNSRINIWLDNFNKTKKYKSLIRKYFSTQSTITHHANTKKKNKVSTISSYDKIIKKYAKKHNIDWRFVASIIYQESKFIPNLTGYGNSYGLMQFMPETMTYYGIDETSSEEAQIEAGIRHLEFLKKSFLGIKNQDEQYFFIAAAYNAGRGHIFDAQRLCVKYNEDSTNWQSVAKYLILKSKKEYARDPVVESGFYPGKHTVEYADEVMKRYITYKAVFQE